MFIEIVLKDLCPKCNKPVKQVIGEYTIDQNKISLEHICYIIADKIHELTQHLILEDILKCCNTNFTSPDIQIYINSELLFDTEIIFNPKLWEAHSDMIEQSTYSRLRQIANKKLS